VTSSTAVSEPSRTRVDTPQQATARDWLAGRSVDRWDALGAVLVALAVVVVGYVFRSIVVPADPWHYVRSAAEFPSDRWVALGYSRYGLILPIIPVVKAFGTAQVTYYFWPLVSAGALAACVFLLGARWWGRVAGVMAVVLLVSNRVFFYNLSRGYPDIMSMALFVVALLLALAARDRMVAGRRAWPWLVAVGVLLGWGFEVRETSVLAWPIVALILWRGRRTVVAAVLVALPVLAWLALDVAISAWAYGDPLLKYHVLTGLDAGAARTATGEVKNYLMVGKPRSFYFTYIPTLALERPNGLVMVVLGAAGLLALAVRHGAIRFMGLWFICVYGLTTLLGGGLDPDHPRGLLFVERYWIPFLPALALAAAGLSAWAVRWVVRRTGRGWVLRRPWVPQLVVAALLCWSPVAFVVHYATTHPAFPPGGGAALEELRDELSANGFRGGRVFTDWETVRILPAYQKPFLGGDAVWPGEPRSVTGPVKPARGDHVLLFERNSRTCPFCWNALARWVEKNPDGPPANWHPVFTSSHGVVTLYEVR
jgi:hypothetical protein